MPGTSRQQSKNPAAENLQKIEPSVEEKINNKASKKSLAAESSEIDETVEAEANPSAKKSKIAKTKVIRDSFSFPKQDYLKISELKKTCLAAGIHVKKSEILRA